MPEPIFACDLSVNSDCGLGEASSALKMGWEWISKIASRIEIDFFIRISLLHALVFSVKC